MTRIDTGRAPYQKGQKAAKKPRKGLRPVSRERQQHWQSPEGKADLTYMAGVRNLPCIICKEFGLPQTHPTEAHHPIHGRYSSRKAPDLACIPLCEGCHRGDMDTTKTAIHREPSKWKRLYGEDANWIERTQDDVERMRALDGWMTAQMGEWT